MSNFDFDTADPELMKVVEKITKDYACDLMDILKAHLQMQNLNNFNIREVDRLRLHCAALNAGLMMGIEGFHSVLPYNSEIVKHFKGLMNDMLDKVIKEKDEE